MEETLENSISRMKQRMIIFLSSFGISAIFFTLRIAYRASKPIERSDDGVPLPVNFLMIISLIAIVVTLASFIGSCAPSKSFQTKLIALTIEAILFVLIITSFIGRAVLFLKDFRFYYYNTINDEKNSILCLDAAVVLWIFILWPITIVCNHLEFIYHLICGTKSGLAKHTGTLKLVLFIIGCILLYGSVFIAFFSPTKPNNCLASFERVLCIWLITVLNLETLFRGQTIRKFFDVIGIYLAVPLIYSIGFTVQTGTFSYCELRISNEYYKEAEAKFKLNPESLFFHEIIFLFSIVLNCFLDMMIVSKCIISEWMILGQAAEKTRRAGNSLAQTALMEFTQFKVIRIS